jgi:predicted transcriptional regulator
VLAWRVWDIANAEHSGDKPLATALEMMNNEGVSSLPVLDAQNNVIGNISHVDVRVSHSPTQVQTNY